MKRAISLWGMKEFVSFCLLNTCLLHAEVFKHESGMSAETNHASQKGSERVDWKAFADAIDWNKYADVMIQKQEAVRNKYTSATQDYMLMLQENELLRSIWLDNRKKIYQSFAIVDHKRYNDAGIQLRAVVLDSVVEDFIEKMKQVVSSSQSRIARTEQELVDIEIQYDEFQKNRQELEQVYEIILRHGVINEAELKDGIQDMNAVYVQAIDARKAFLDSMYKLVEETEETIRSIEEETLLQSSVIVASNGQVVKRTGTTSAA